MTDFVLILVTGLGLGALYFLAASGLSIIYGLMGVLNFAHGAFMMAVGRRVPHDGSPAGHFSVAARLAIAVLVALVVGAVIGFIVEVVLIRPLYRHHIQQVLVTVGLPSPVLLQHKASGVLTPAQGEAGVDGEHDDALGARLPNDRFLFIAVALASSSACRRCCTTPASA